MSDEFTVSISPSQIRVLWYKMHDYLVNHADFVFNSDVNKNGRN
ncbi:hypothetical protein E27107_200061 [Elizabethkingia anophelis]|nr:hypothetical protein EZBTHKR_3076 [Elizabethkingia anophelis]CDN74722.1 hypothetical protein E18064_360062 [Elizabethkingia anophelis]CDN77408.1 hypothetical protein E27107_200061 [Elizabethkingia anophelis]